MHKEPCSKILAHFSLVGRMLNSIFSYIAKEPEIGPAVLPLDVATSESILSPGATNGELTSLAVYKCTLLYLFCSFPLLRRSTQQEDPVGGCIALTERKKRAF